MAQKVYTESVITMNTAAAELAIKALNEKIKRLNAEMKEAINAKNSTLAEKLAREINSNEKAIANTRKSTYEYSQVLKNINGSTLNQQESTSKTHYLNMKIMV